MKKILFSCLVVLMMAGISQASGQWVHVHVNNPGEAQKVRINIPVSLVETMLPLIEEKGMEKGKIKLDDKEMKVEDLRKMWNELRKQGDAEFLSVEDKDTNVKIFTQGNFLMVQPQEHAKGKVNIKVPLAVVDALLSGSGDELNLAAAVKALKDSGVRDIISVEDKDTTVRVWIDENNTAR